LEIIFMKKKKSKYETPVILPLGELARGSGMPPNPPSACSTGTGAGKNCKSGGGVVKEKPNCSGGSNASTSCVSGVGVV